MIRDAESRSDDWLRGQVFDACVIGAGPAGITVARRLASRGASVALCEGGGLEATAESQEIYAGRNGGQPYYPLDGCRLRYFGGTSNHWGGWTRPLDDRDFEAREDHPLSGWPISRRDLDPFASEADRILDVEPNFDPPDMFAGASEDLEPGIFRFSQPVTRFGEKYRKELDEAAGIHVFLNANVIDLELDDARQSVRHAIFRSYARPDPFTIDARFFVLCLGGLENPRFLLNANRQCPGGIGNEHDLVGRYFLEHPHVPVGRVVVRDPLTFMLVYSPSRAFMHANHILSFGLRIGNWELTNGTEFSGAFDPQPACTVGFDDILAAEIRREKAPCPAHVGDAFLVCEQSLNPESRVRLTDTRDAFGLKRIELDWRLTEIDFRTISTAALQFAKLMAVHDVGRMKVVEWLMREDRNPNLNELFGGNHHMGTTRMSNDPKAGVVDGNCRIHALTNLYLGGSSVFASSGHANPTYTIVQLALRLGDHIAALLV